MGKIIICIYCIFFRRNILESRVRGCLDVFFFSTIPIPIPVRTKVPVLVKMCRPDLTITLIRSHLGSYRYDSYLFFTIPWDGIPTFIYCIRSRDRTSPLRFVIRYIVYTIAMYIYTHVHMHVHITYVLYIYDVYL
jgi:hypothetical protein